jgi:curved DNA-binding protein
MAATDFKDYYAVLGVSKSADTDAIKRAYRKLARKYHPDVNPGDQTAEAKFKEVTEAYEVLSDKDKRQKYDQFGQYWRQAERGGSPFGGGGASAPDFNNFDFGSYGSFEDFINELLGRFNTPGAGPTGAGGYRPPGGFGTDVGSDGFGRAGAAAYDQEANITLTLAEAFNGTQKRLRIGSDVVDVRIPAGARAGSKIRLRGKGPMNPRTRQRGDVYLLVNLAAHSFFQFEGDNLVCEVPITPDEAVLGGKIEVPTVDGQVTVNVPAGVKSGQALRLRGKGWPNPKGGRSDQMVKLAIATPKQISPAERALYEQIQAKRTEDPRAHLKAVGL